MKLLRPIRNTLVAVGILALTAAFAAGQDRPVLQNLRVNGSTAFDLEHDSSGNGAGQTFSGGSYGGEVDTQIQGDCLDPRFIDFASNWSLGRTVNHNPMSSGGSTMWAGGGSLRFLPGSDHPFDFYYQRTSSGVGADGFNSLQNTSYLGVQWRLERKNLPQIQFDFNRNSTLTDVVTSLSDHNAVADNLGINVHDMFKGWTWSVGASKSNSSTWANVFNTPVELVSHGDGLSAGLGRPFWERRGSVNYSFSRTYSYIADADLGHVTSNFTNHQVNLMLRPTDRLTTSYSLQDFTSSQESVIAADTPGVFTWLPAVPAHVESLSGDASYRLNDHLFLTDNAHYTTQEILPTPTEVAKTLLSDTPGIAATYAWHRITFNGHYGLQWDSLTTNFDRRFSDFAHTGTIGASWGNAKLVQLSGSFNVTHTTVAELAGAYVNNRQFSFAGETYHFERIGRIRFRLNHQIMDSLTTPGVVNTNHTDWGVTLIRTRVQADFGTATSSGLQQAFAVPTGVFQPLPVSSLIGVPLLNGLTHSKYITVSGQLRPGLLVGGDYRRESNDMLMGILNYTVIDLHASYRVGKISVDVAYGRYINASQLNQGGLNSTSNMNRLRIRIARSFNLF